MTNFRIEYFRDRVLIKACPSHGSKSETVEAAKAGLVTHNAQLAVIRDCAAGNVEIASISRVA